MNDTATIIIKETEIQDVLEYFDLTTEEQKEFDFGGAEECGFFRYNDEVYCVNEFTRIENEESEYFSDWQAIYSTSAFSGMLVKDYDGDCVTVAYFYQKDGII